jgi:agmatine deiminase
MTYYQPPEWAPHAAVWIGFPSEPMFWLRHLAAAQAEVAAFARAVHADGEGETVYLVASNTDAATVAETLAGDCAVIIIEPFGDIWLRDTGTIIVLHNDRYIALDYPGNGWGNKYNLPDDKTIGYRLAKRAGFEVHSRDMIFEGGSIDVDGSGWAATTRQCLLNPNRNPDMSQADMEQQLINDFGIRQILWLDQGVTHDHTDGHVDNLARFVGPNLLAIPKAVQPDDPNMAVFVASCEQATAAGITTASVPSAGRYQFEGKELPASHMNFYIGNAAVIVPVYGRPSDAEAVAAVSSFFPDRATMGLPANHILTGGGSFHCISQQVPR